MNERQITAVMVTSEVEGFMIKLRAKISSPLVTGIMFGLLNIAAVLFVALLGLPFFDKLSDSSLQVPISVLLAILTFPANMFSYSYQTSTGGGSINFFFLNPLIWGLGAFVIHNMVKSYRSSPGNSGSESLKSG